MLLERIKLLDVFERLIPLYLAAGDLEKTQYLLWTSSTIKVPHSVPILLSYVKEQAQNSSAKWMKTDILDYILDFTKLFPEVREQFQEWFWSTPIPIGNEHAFQLFTGLLWSNPQDFPNLLVRLDAINQTLDAKDSFDPAWIWTVIVKMCPEEVIQVGLQRLPQRLNDQLISLREKHPQLFGSESE